MWFSISSWIRRQYYKYRLSPNWYLELIQFQQKVLVTWMSADGWLDKESVVYAYNGILFNLNKENLAICDNMDEPWEL